VAHEPTRTDDAHSPSEDLFSSLRSSILLRVRDKDAHVRVQAVIALSAFLAAEPSDEDEEDVTEVLMEIMATDPAA
jgi:condensin complex subunit 3